MLSNTGSSHSLSNDVGGEERISEILNDLVYAIGAEGELPVADHGVGLQQLHAVDHVLAVGLQRGIGALPGVAAIEEQHLVVAAFGADGLDQRGGAVKPAQLAVGGRQVHVIKEGVGVGQRRARLDAEVLEELLAHQVRRNAGIVAHADIGVRRPEVDGLELGVHVGEVQQRDLTL